MIQLESSTEVRGRVMGILQFTPGLHFVGAYPLALAAGSWVGKWQSRAPQVSPWRYRLVRIGA